MKNPAKIYAILAAYGLLSMARSAALFYLFEKESRIKATENSMFELRLHRPDNLYADPADYFLQVVNSPKVTNEAKLSAGATIGTIEAFRLSGRPFQTISLLIVLEAAIERYESRFDL
jgi:hypothetical protein